MSFLIKIDVTKRKEKKRSMTIPAYTTKAYDKILRLFDFQPLVK